VAASSCSTTAGPLSLSLCLGSESGVDRGPAGCGRNSRLQSNLLRDPWPPNPALKVSILPNFALKPTAQERGRSSSLHRKPAQRRQRSCATATWVGKKIRFGSEMCIMEHSLVEKEKLHAKYHVSFHQANLSSEWASATRGTAGPSTQDQGVCGSGSGVHCHARPAPVPIRCAQARPLGAGPLRLLRTAPVTYGIAFPP
jgi:hypothetical protein